MSAKAKNGSRSKTPKIPKTYRKPLKKKTFENLIKMLADAGEKKAMEAAFPEGGDGRRHYAAPADAKSAKEVARILKKVRKARSGPRTFRLILVAIVIGAPVLFNVFFVDRAAARRLERLMEERTGTDVTVEGLDIAPLQASIRLEKLAVASETDPMTDDWVLEGLSADFRWSSLFYRRALIDEISGGFGLKVPREKPAVYPEGADSRSSSERKRSGMGFDLEKLPAMDVPVASADLARELRENAEAEYEALTEGLEEDMAEAGETADRVAELLGRSLPGERDIAGWTTLVKDGRELAESLKAQREKVEDYRNRLERTRRAAREASVEARRAVEEDLANLEAAVSLDREMLTGWMETAIGTYIGPRAEDVFEKVSALRSGRNDEADGKEAGRKSRGEGRGRMKSGRIVPFPVRLPPRFTIGEMHFSAPGAALDGTHVGIDHDLAGAPTVIDLEIDGMDGFEGRLSARIVADGRTGADDLVRGSLDASGRRWTSGRAPDSLGGTVDATAEFFVRTENTGLFVAQGEAVLANWSGRLGSGSVDVVSETFPPLSVEYDLEVENGGISLHLALAEGTFRAWSRLLAESLLPLGAEQAKAALLDAVGADLDGLDEVLAGLDGNGADLDNLSGMLSSQQRELEKALDEWSREALGGMDVPGADDAVEKAAKGLRSLF